MKVIANASTFNISSFFCSENSQSNMENILWDNTLFILIIYYYIYTCIYIIESLCSRLWVRAPGGLNQRL